MDRIPVLAAALALSMPHATAQEPAGTPEPPAVEVTSVEAAGEGAQIRLPGMKSLTITGQYRIRYEYRMDFDFDDDAGADEDFFTQRIRLNFAPEFTDTISGLIQVQDAREWGEETSTLDDDADGLDLHQGWIRIDEFPGVGGTGKVGRQTVELGDQRLVSSLEWASQGRAFDGYRHTWSHHEPHEHGIDGFFFQTREIVRNANNDDAYFTGLYGTAQLRDDLDGDIYAMFLHDQETPAAGSENRLTLGTRWAYRVGDLELGAEYATQLGQVDGADIPIGKTWALHAHARLSWPELRCKPWVQAEANFASGDDPSTSDAERFDGLFPFSHAYWGYMDLALWENLQHFTVQVGAVPGTDNKLALHWHYFRAMEETDAFGGTNGTLSPGAAGQSKTMGNEVDVVFTQELDTKPLRTILEAGYGLFVPGAGAQAAAGADDLAHFLYAQADFRF